jgi:hypothetical protein
MSKRILPALFLGLAIAADSSARQQKQNVVTASR